MRTTCDHDAAAAAALLTAALAAGLGACSGGGNVNLGKSQVADPATVDFPIFYVKRQVPMNSTGTVLQDDLRVLRDAVPSADLYKRASASPSALETNITARLTAGASWDVKDVDTSADGTRVVFAMRSPLAMNQDPKKPPSWRIYEYLIPAIRCARSSSRRPIPRSTTCHRTTCRRAHRVLVHAPDAVAGHPAR